MQLRKLYQAIQKRIIMSIRVLSEIPFSRRGFYINFWHKYFLSIGRK